VDDLLWLARFDDDQSVVSDEEEADVGALAVESVERFQPVALGRELDLRVDVVEDGRAVIRAESSWIDRLIGVLVDNACKYAGQEGSVVVAVGLTGNRVVLRVDDSGPGIPIAQRPYVLDRFHRGTDGPGGTGLGLAIADSVVRATSGEWLIADAPTGGARLEVSWKKIGGGNTSSHESAGHGFSEVRYASRSAGPVQARADIPPQAFEDERSDRAPTT
jgi:signal transduction histidine kinase